jgi:hypothetical protein
LRGALIAVLAPTLALFACGPREAAAPDQPPAPVTYDGIETLLLDGDLVNFRVRTTGGTDADGARYAECAAAQYTLIRGYGFARHVRTITLEQSGIRTTDAVYTISPALPRGERTIDAEVTTADCLSAGIPTV